MPLKISSMFSAGLRAAFVLLLVMVSVSSFATIRYVKFGGAGNGSGLSWTNASGDLQGMINASADGDEVWVAVGTYRPILDPLGNISPADPRDRCFYLKSGVKVFGGFAGTESTLDQRNIGANPTILNGDFDGNDLVSGSGGSLAFSNNGENAYHVVVTISDDNTTELNGFTITGGNANGNGLFVSGSEYFHQSTGAGVVGKNASLAIRNCTLTGNNAEGALSGGAGGAFYFLDGSPQLENCTIINNNAGSGGGFHGNYCTATFKNCVLYGNKAFRGSAVQIENNGRAYFTNCTFTQNSTTFLGVLYSNNNAGLSVVNCIVWNNNKGSGNSALIAGTNSWISATYSILQDDQCCGSGTGLKFGQDPRFVNIDDPAGPDGIHRTADDGLSILSRISPAINAGNPAVVEPPSDITGFARTGIFDMGAYEMRNPCPPSTTRFYVKPVASGTGDGSSWANATSDLQSVINECGFEIWVASGTYKPTCDVSGNCNPADPRDRTFRLWSGARVYGGFNGTETELSQRNTSLYRTILSGDFDGNDVITPATIGFNFSGNDENANIVVSAIDAGPSTVLDGFTITGGKGIWGGGMLVKGLFNGSTISISQPTVNGCIFYANYAQYGGGMYSESSSARVTNCLFWGNNAHTQGGGHFNFDNSNATFSNCTFVGNRAYEGGAIFNMYYGYLTFPTYTNCIIWGNESGIGDIGNRVVVNNSIVQNGHPGSGNLIVDPQFVAPTIGDFRVQICSPAINAGNNDAIAGSLYDLNLLPRRYNNNTVDIGAYEFQASSIIPIIYTVSGGGSECEGNTIAPVVLSGSQTGIQYQWKINGANQGGPVEGTGAALNFGPLSAGQYTVAATSIDGCTKVMDGLANVAFGEFTLNLVSVNGITGEPMTLIPNPGNIFQNIEWRLNGEPVATGTSNTFTPEECGTWTAFATNFTGCTTLSNELEILTRWYADADADGYGNPAVYQDACTQPTGYVPNREDCDDSNNAVNPAALEICNDGIDNNCDGKMLELTAPTVVPSSVTGCAGDNATLSVSSPSGAIQWFDAPSGGNLVATGREIGLTLQTSRTLYAQSPPLQQTRLSGVDTVSALAVAEHNSLTGDDGRGIAITPDYVFYTGDNNTVRYDHNLQNGVQLPRIDGMFSDLASGRLYAFLTDTGFARNAIDRIQPLDVMGQPDGAAVMLSQSLTNLSTNRSIVFNGFGYVLFYDHNSKDFFRIALPSGNVTVIKEDYEIADHRIAETYWSWYMSEFDGNEYSLVYRVQGQQLLVRVNLATEQKDTVATFAGIGNDAAQFVFSPWDNRLFVHNEGSNFYNNNVGGEWMFAFGATNLIQCNEAPRTAVPVTVNTIATWYTDADGDSYGTGTGQQLCSNPGTGWANRAGDCNDANGAINPGATEVCSNGIDDNCNGTIDEGSVLTTPGPISGPVGVCRGATGQVFSVAPVPFATSYQWILPNGATGSSTTNSIVLNFSSTYNMGMISVKAISSCNQTALSARQIQALTSKPGTPKNITGKNLGTCVGNEIYSIPAVANATGYNWVAPANTTIVNGQGTTSIELSFAPGFVSGNLSVTASNCMGTSTARTLQLLTKPGTPAAIVGPASVCPGAVGIKFSTTGLAGVTYNWQVPSGATITNGQGTAAITVTWGTAAGNVRVSAGNVCGVSAFRSRAVSLLSCSTLITMAQAEQVEEAKAENKLAVNLWPNPARDVLMVTLNEFVPNQKMEMVLMSTEGRSLKAESLVPAVKGQQVRFDVRSYATGIYLLHIKQGMLTETKKVMIAR